MNKPGSKQEMTNWLKLFLVAVNVTSYQIYQALVLWANSKLVAGIQILLSEKQSRAASAVY